MAHQLALPLGFNARQGFGQFWPGPNDEVVAHLRQAALGQGDSPLFIWGVEGAGKTHLLNAACALASDHGRRAAYLPLRTLSALGPDILTGVDQFDVVCVDDLDPIAGLPEWEVALFELFNQLRDHGRTLLISARRPPPQLPFRLPDLQSRLAWGLTLHIHPLREDDTLQALSLQAKALGMDLTPAAGRFLMSHTRRDLPALLTLLQQLDRASLAAQRRLTIPFIKSQIGEQA